jgi:hypothetical protein
MIAIATKLVMLIMALLFSQSHSAWEKPQLIYGRDAERIGLGLFIHQPQADIA